MQFTYFAFLTLLCGSVIAVPLQRRGGSLVGVTAGSPFI